MRQVPIYEREIDEPFVLDIAKKAAAKFGGSDGMFNSANFSAVFKEESKMGLLDGIVVSMILSRPSIERVGKAHWRILEQNDALGCAGNR